MQILQLLFEGVDFDKGLLVLNGDTLSDLDLSQLDPSKNSFAVSYNPSFLKRYQPLFVDQNDSWIPSKEKTTNAKSCAFFRCTHSYSPRLFVSLKQNISRRKTLVCSTASTQSFTKRDFQQRRRNFYRKKIIFGLT